MPRGAHALIPLLLAAGGMALPGCEAGGGGGTEAEVESDCKLSGRSGTCTIKIVRLSGGAYRHEISNDEFWTGANAVDVTARVSVGQGTVRVWLEDPKQRKIAAAAAPGRPAEVKGKASVDNLNDKGEFSVYFEPAGEGAAKRAENVQAEVRYNMP